MISVLVYGRNDSYGYNLHKRVALSLNAIAEILDATDDEILFADYNTPDSLPTFPEAVHDTLTARTRTMLRILRIRPHIHLRYAAKTHLPVLEPVARNAALRRSNPANRWILSTNTDMILAPRGGRTLTEIAAGLADGYYHLPRFELPQTLWETLDRLNPREAIELAAQWGRALHLNEVVGAQQPYIMHDGPGDFQLMRRADLFRINGFDERIMLGWHIDANVARRLFLQYGRVGTLEDVLQGYHCEHTRQATPKHAPGRLADDFSAAVEAVETPEIHEQATTWGLAADTIEEARLHPGESSYANALRSAIGPEMRAPSFVAYSGATYNKVDYDVRHVLPFLCDAVVCLPRTVRLGWFASRRDLLERSLIVWRALGYLHPIEVGGSAPWLGPHLPDGAVWSDVQRIVATAQVCVFDFAMPGAPSRDLRCPELQFVADALRALAMAEAARPVDAEPNPCRVITVNAINNIFETLVSSHVSVNSSPIATRLRQGFVLGRQDQSRDLLPALHTGVAGRRAPDGNEIELIADLPGTICFGPYLDLPPGSYRLTLELDVKPAADAGLLLLEIVAGTYWLAHRLIAAADFRGPSVSLAFNVAAELVATLPSLMIEMRLRTDGRIRGALRAARIEPVAEASPRNSTPQDWLPLMSVGAGGEVARNNRGHVVRVHSRTCGHAVFGPYCTLLPGRYGVTFTLRSDRRPPWRHVDARPPPIVLEVMAGATCLASLAVVPNYRKRIVRTLPVTIAAGPADAESGKLLEFRVWTSGSLAFVVQSVQTERLD